MRPRKPHRPSPTRRRRFDTADSLGIAEHEALSVLREQACPLCFLVSKSERRLVDTSWREAVADPAVQESFVRAGGLWIYLSGEGRYRTTITGQ
jgi:hypothetical protein